VVSAARGFILKIPQSNIAVCASSEHQDRVMEYRETELALTRVRIAELRERAEQLAERGRELRDAMQREGSGLGDVHRARERAEIAKSNAIQAQERAAMAYMRSAAAHEAAAERHELLAAGGFGDPEDHLRLARRHRELCAEDRKAGNSAGAFLTEV
jgi:hypothetical protein